MFRIQSVGGGLVVGLCILQVTVADDPPEKAKITLEFRWAEFKPIPGVTEEQGQPFGEGDTPLYYLHKKPALTIKDVAAAYRGGTLEVGGASRIKVHEAVLRMTDEAKMNLTLAPEVKAKKPLMIVINGKSGSGYFVESLPRVAWSFHVRPLQATSSPDSQFAANSTFTARSFHSCSNWLALEM
jgi:hypothetical protein